jgi:RNA polymerase sigma-70 factor (ECF subfamily)
MTSKDRTPEFVDLFTKSSRQIYAFIMSLLRRKDDTEEVYQEVSRTLWEKFDEFVPETNFTAWACEVAYRKTLEFRRRDRRLPTLFSDLFVETIEQAFVRDIEQEPQRYSAMQDCLEKLSERDRRLIARRYGGGVSPAQIAQEEKRSLSAIHKALSRIHEALHDCIERALRRESSS